MIEAVDAPLRGRWIPRTCRESGTCEGAGAGIGPDEVRSGCSRSRPTAVTALRGDSRNPRRKAMSTLLKNRGARWALPPAELIQALHQWSRRTPPTAAMELLIERNVELEASVAWWRTLPGGRAASVDVVVVLPSSRLVGRARLSALVEDGLPSPRRRVARSLRCTGWVRLQISLLDGDAVRSRLQRAPGPWAGSGAEAPQWRRWGFIEGTMDRPRRWLGLSPHCGGSDEGFAGGAADTRWRRHGSPLRRAVGDRRPRGLGSVSTCRGPLRRDGHLRAARPVAGTRSHLRHVGGVELDADRARAAQAVSGG